MKSSIFIEQLNFILAYPLTFSNMCVSESTTVSASCNGMYTGISPLLDLVKPLTSFFLSLP